MTIRGRVVVPTFGGNRVIDQFSRHQASRNFTDRTIKRRALTLRQLERLIAPTPLLEATGDDLSSFIASKPSARTRHAYRSDLRVFFQWALKRGYITADPSVLLDSIKVQRSLPRPFSGDLTVLFEFGSLRARQMAALGLYAGLRCAEIAVLDASDVITHTDPKVIVVREGKGRKDRVVRIHPLLLDQLGQLPSSGLLFANARTRQAVTPATVGRAIKRHLEACGIDGVPHQLRHTFGTELARISDGDLQVVADAMGHGSMETTRGYTAFTGGRSAALIGQMFGGDAA